MAIIDAPNGDTNMSVAVTQQPFVLDLSNHADGNRLWIANLDPANVVTVEANGAHANTARWNLSKQGDWIELPAGDITRVAVFGSTPAGVAAAVIIGYGFEDPGVIVRAGLARTS